MIVRILNEGQWRVSDDAVPALNELDDEVERAVSEGDQAELARALQSLHERVRSIGSLVPDDELADSDLILPASDSTLEEVRSLLSESGEGLIPN